MPEGGIPVDLIIILAIAAFVVFKYRQILGHKTGHDVESHKDQLHQRRMQSEERVVQLRQYQREEEDEETPSAPKDTALEEMEDNQIRKKLEEVKAQDPSFTLDDFLKGAKGAFEMIIDAFNNADRQTLKMLLAEDLYEEFDRELKKLSKDKHSSHTTLVSIQKAEVLDATIHQQTARLIVSFLTEQIHVVKNADGKIIEGDPSRIEQVEDEWTFERTIKSRNPNWTIVDM